MVGKATHAEVTLLSKYLGRFADVPAAVVALNFIGGVDDVLSEDRRYIEAVGAVFLVFFCGGGGYKLFSVEV